MIRVMEIAAMGFEPVAWSVPNIGNKRTKGKRVRFTTYKRKTDYSTGRLGLKDWQEHIKNVARDVMAGREMESGPLHVHFEFYAKTPVGNRHGELWDVRLEKDKKTGAWVKRNRKHSSNQEPDVTNMQKAAEDALTGVVWVDDCKNRFISATAFFSAVPGVRIYINRIEPGDYPGRGEPVS